MRLPASQRARWALVVAIFVLALAALNAWWVATYRDGYPFDIDEAGYTTFGLVDHLSLKYTGLHGWWDTIQNQPKFAPLVPALTSLVVSVKPGVLSGFVTLTVFLLILAMAIYGIGERLGGPRLGALAALIAVTSPGAFAFSREYIYALPTAALLACAVYALLRSDGLRLRGWSIACGAALGLMLLARTMAIAYVPGVLGAALIVAIVRSRKDLGKRFVNLALLIGAGIAVASTWYAKNLVSVIEYLTEYGYGKQSKYYGDEHALISWGRFRSVGEHMTTEDFFLPLAVLLLLGLTAMAVIVGRRLWRAEDRRSALTRIAATDALSVALVFAVGYAGLMSSQNGGDGFTFPLAVLLPPLAVLAIRRFKSTAIVAVGAFALVATINIVSTSTIWATASRTRLVSVPGFAEALPLTKGVPKAVFAFRAQVPGPEFKFDEHDAEWLRADHTVLEVLVGLYGPNEEAPVIAFGSRNRALTSNSVQLASVLTYSRGMPLLQLEAEPRGSDKPSDSVATYVEQLSSSELGTPTVLITMNRNTDDFPPPVTPARVEIAARSLGFRKIHRLTLPDGRLLYVWRRQRAASGPHAAIRSRSTATDAPRPALARGSRRG